MRPHQNRKQIEDGSQQQQTDHDIDHRRRGLGLDELGMEPAIPDRGNIASLAQEIILGAHLIDELTILADEMDIEQ